VDILSFLLERPTTVAEIESTRACFDALEKLDATFSSSVDRAAAGGFLADRIGYAFLAGYRAALYRLDPTLSRASLCASEEAGVHPRSIKTRLAPHDGAFVLDGDKTFATLASAADTLLVVASRGQRDGRNWLQIARIPANREGVTIRDRDPIEFAPEIRHARVAFRNVRVSPEEILEGDGYERVLKPFRTIEDIHVMAACLGHVVRLVRAHGESRDLAERALAAIAAFRDLEPRDPSSRAVHVALAGVITTVGEVARGMTLAGADEATRARWNRDLPLLMVAGTARELRREAAWRALLPPTA
jgi:acyl-CoA dehydrogenase